MAPGGVSLGATNRRLGERAIRVALFAAAAVSVLTTLGILVALLRETVAFFGDVGIGHFITDGEWSPLFAPPHYGIWQLINGTFLQPIEWLGGVLIVGAAFLEARRPAEA